MSNVLFICNGVASDDDRIGVSGGDARFFEIASRVKDVDRYFLVAKHGEILIDRYGIDYKKKFVIDYKVGTGIKSNLAISLKSLFQFPKGLATYRGVVYSSCEHLYDVLPALRLRLTHGCRWIAVYHWVEEYPWKDKRGGTPFLKRYVYWLNRWFSGFLIKHFAHTVLAVSEPTKEKLVSMKGISPDRIEVVYCGVDYDRIVGVTEKWKSEKGENYDAVYMKRLSYGKGVLDLLEVWKKVCGVNPKARLVVMGGGTPDTMAKIKEYIDGNGLQNNIELLGPVHDFEKKFRIINSAKLFLLPSHEENWAIVIGEAMAAGVPVLCYDLKEIRPIWQEYVQWIPLADTATFADKVMELLGKADTRAKLSDEARAFVKRYGWDDIAAREEKIMHQK